MELLEATFKKKVYIAHPLTSFGGPKENYDRVTEICKEIVKDNQVIPISPIHAFTFYPWEGCQQQAIESCLHLLRDCNELWLYGQWCLSKGCKTEITFALKNKIPVIVKEFSEDVKNIV